MGLLKHEYAVVTIGGTNGKGSSAAMLESIMISAGYKVGVYTSPHLIRYNERIRIDGIEVSDEKLCQSFHRIDQARQEISLTYFEFGTLAAMDIFQDDGIGVAIMEVGLGGRLDAVNILDADVALICSIALDHENWLGNDREKIGFEKAGIFRRDKPAICTETLPPTSIISHANSTGTPLHLAGRDFYWEIDKGIWHWQSHETQRQNLPIPDNNNHQQVQNAAGVLKVLEVLKGQFPVGTGEIHQGLLNFHLPGRFEILQGAVTWVLDVAHNQQSTQVLVENIKKLCSNGGNKHIIIGMLEDKRHELVLAELLRVVDIWSVVSLDSNRAVDCRFLAQKLYQLGITDNVHLFDKINIAFENARKQAKAGDTIIVTGSFLTVAAAMKWLGAEHK